MNKYLKTKEGSLEDLAKQMQNKVLESDYQDKFKKELDKAGKPIGQMTGAEKKAFFNKIDKMHSAKNEQAKNPYAIGMAAAMKAKDDKPPLKKSTITKAHDIAKSIEKDQKESVEIKEANITLHDHDSTDKEFKDLVKKSNLTMKVKRGYKGDNVTLSGNPMNIEKMLKTMYGNDWNKTYKRRGNEYIEAEYKKEDYTKQDVDKFHTKLVKLVHKSFGHSSDEKKKEMKEARWEIEGRVSYKGVGPEDGFHMVIDAPTENAAEDKAYNELEKARRQRKIGPGGGGNIDDMEIEYIEKTNDRLQPVTQQHLKNNYDPKLKENFFVNDKKDTLKKFSGRIGYNKSTLTDYLAKKTGKNKNDVYFDDTELVYKDKTVLRNAETKTIDQMLKALQKEEVHPHVKKMVKDGESDVKIKKMHPELKDDELEKLKETHMSTAKAQNQKQKEVGGEKEPIKTSKNEWKTFAMMAAELREKKEEKKEQEAGEDTRDPKDKTMTGKVATSPEMNPRVDYKY